jgi:HEAT repeats
MSLGLAFMIGLLLGAAIFYFVLQSKIKSKESALQQSRRQLERLEHEHQERISEVTHQLQSDFDTQLAEKIERYQDQHAQQLADLEAEYETRITVFDSLHDNAMTGYAPTVADNDGYEEADSTPIESGFIGTVAAATANAVNAIAAVLPDPWSETGSTPSTPSVIPLSPQPTTATTATLSEPSTAQQKAQALGEMAALNVQAALKAIPQLGQLSQDADPATRLAAVQSLAQTGSVQAIPLLRRALRDPDNAIVAAASAALDRFKGTPVAKAASSLQKDTKKGQKKLPKNR